ncbi:MAG: type IV pilus modification protein PilV [Gammaproteobacteria bacterium]|jgi:type IV pilus assembly protein PilV
MKHQQGISMIEVLVSLLILSLGLLGVAGLQSTSLHSNQSAYLHSQATVAANDIIDRMRSNPEGVADGVYDDVDSEAALPADPNCITSASGCTAAQLADYDVREWVQTSLAVLPSATATVTLNNMGTAADTTDDVFVVTVNWDDPMDAQNPNKTLVMNVQLYGCVRNQDVCV